MNKAILYAFIVSWTVTFKPPFGNSWDYQRAERFDTYESVQTFMNLAPKNSFECVDYYYGQDGQCLVSNMKVEGEGL